MLVKISSSIFHSYLFLSNNIYIYDHLLDLTNRELSIPIAPTDKSLGITYSLVDSFLNNLIQILLSIIVSDIRDSPNITLSVKDVNTFVRKYRHNNKKVLKLNCEGTKGKKEVIK